MTWIVVRDNALRLIAKLVIRAGMLSLFLSIFNKVSIRKRSDQRLTFPYIRNKRDQRFQILIYHRVNDEFDPFFGAIPISVFADQVEMLNKYFNVLPLEELVSSVTHSNIPPNSLAITFDDGYKDNFKNAFPILKDYGMPATVFISTGPPETYNILWHDRVFSAIRCTNAVSVRIGADVYPLDLIPDRQAALRAFRELIFESKTDERDKIIDDFIKRLNVKDHVQDEELMLNWQDIQTMAKNNISIGAHTVTHPILTRMPLIEAVNEIVSSKKIIETKLNCPVRSFAYPKGRAEDFNTDIKNAIREAGFACAVTTVWGNNNASTDPFELKRIQPWDAIPSTFALRLGLYKFLS